jgi:hypothetical protein
MQEVIILWRGMFFFEEIQIFYRQRTYKPRELVMDNMVGFF